MQQLTVQTIPYFLYREFLDDRIRSRGFWPSHSPNLYPSNFHTWEMLKDIFYSKILSLMRVSKITFIELCFILIIRKSMLIVQCVCLLGVTRVSKLKENISKRPSLNMAIVLVTSIQ